MADRVTGYAKRGEWDKYKKAVKRKWKKYIDEKSKECAENPIEMERDVLVLMANRLPVELMIEPELWHAAQEKAGKGYQLKATIRELLKLWVAGNIDPWDD